jgi:hypothetical protein
MKQAIKGRAPLVIAGGSVRDVLNNRPVKDIDVFMQVPDWEHDPLQASELIDEVVAAVGKLFYSPGVSRETVIVNDPDAEGDASDISYDIHSVWHWTCGFNCMPVDIVFIKEDPAKCYEAFDFGLCQALVSPVYGLRTSRAYQRDSLNREITFLLNAAQRDRSRVHLSHFLPKYPGWKVRGIAA